MPSWPGPNLDKSVEYSTTPHTSSHFSLNITSSAACMEQHHDWSQHTMETTCNQTPSNHKCPWYRASPSLGTPTSPGCPYNKWLGSSDTQRRCTQSTDRDNQWLATLAAHEILQPRRGRRHQNDKQGTVANDPNASLEILDENGEGNQGARASLLSMIVLQSALPLSTLTPPLYFFSSFASCSPTRNFLCYFHNCTKFTHPLMRHPCPNISLHLLNFFTKPLSTSHSTTNFRWFYNQEEKMTW